MIGMSAYRAKIAAASCSSSLTAKSKKQNGQWQEARSRKQEAEAEEDKPVIRAAFELRNELLKRDPAWEKSMDLGVSEESIRRRSEMMLSIDESVGAIVKTLKDKQLLKNTI